MPKSPVSTSPHNKKSKNTQNNLIDNDQSEPNDAMRKKKNADAQAAFRQRRQNYITTLEETGAIHRLLCVIALELTPI